jgi:thiamine pyrophosphokinase
LEITFFDNHGRYFLAKQITTINNCLHKTISLVPLPKASKISTLGLQYSLNKEDLSFGKRIGTRNKAINNEVKITFEKGELVIFVND